MRAGSRIAEPLFVTHFLLRSRQTQEIAGLEAENYPETGLTQIFCWFFSEVQVLESQQKDGSKSIDRWENLHERLASMRRSNWANGMVCEFHSEGICGTSRVMPEIMIVYPGARASVRFWIDRRKLI